MLVETRIPSLGGLLENRVLEELRGLFVTQEGVFLSAAYVRSRSGAISDHAALVVDVPMLVPA